MFRIDNSTAAPALPAPAAAGTPGYFTGGNPGTATPPTILDVDYMNMLMMEIINVLVAAGIAPSKTVYTQLRDAITALAIAAVPFASTPEGLAGTLTNKAMTPAATKAVINALINGAPGALDTLNELAAALGNDANFATTVTTALAARVLTSRLISGGGLATGGGDGTADRTITVPKASSSDIAAGTDDAKAVTSAGIAAAFGGTKGSTAIIPLPGGWLMMAGSGTASANATTTVTLPTTFPNLCVFAGCSGAASNNDAQDNNPAVSGQSTSTISVFNAVDGSIAFTWLAIGY